MINSEFKEHYKYLETLILELKDKDDWREFVAIIPKFLKTFQEFESNISLFKEVIYSYYELDDFLFQEEYDEPDKFKKSLNDRILLIKKYCISKYKLYLKDNYTQYDFENIPFNEEAHILIKREPDTDEEVNNWIENQMLLYLNKMKNFTYFKPYLWAELHKEVQILLKYFKEKKLENRFEIALEKVKFIKEDKDLLEDEKIIDFLDSLYFDIINLYQLSETGDFFINPFEKPTIFGIIIFIVMIIIGIIINIYITVIL